MNYRSAEGARLVEDGYRELLRDWPVPYEEVRVPTSQGETFAVVSGPPDAPPLVLLHGSAANAAMWAGPAGAWARRFRVVAVDMIGEPGLSAPSRPPLASGVYGPWLGEVLDGLGLGRVSVVGTSLGGWLGLEFAVAAPSRVERMVLTCPSGIGRQRYGKLLLALPFLPFGRPGQRVARRILLGPVSLPPESGYFRHKVAIDRYFRPRREKVPIVADLGRLTMPLLVVIGAHDAFLDSRETARRLAHLPNATVRLLPDAGHLLPPQTTETLAFLTG
ncbi:alpha/beta fold hydrolase [Nonomuraea typhae]|uniref:alpha/beta fold hydrolase n=1 Tax=Nonomuraea typhae TaxID=2603600 RepID=UPI0012FBCC77|nr:alpha/beta hydrolase [Nonomuraea typhae]